jgi:TRAP-type C4-dicarboxylate transport system permease small subunit
VESAALVFILIFCTCVLIPCVAIGWVGKNLIHRLGHFPSKTPAIQMSILFKLVVIEVVSMSLILLLFKALTAE